MALETQLGSLKIYIYYVGIEVRTELIMVSLPCSERSSDFDKVIFDLIAKMRCS